MGLRGRGLEVSLRLTDGSVDCWLGGVQELSAQLLPTPKPPDPPLNPPTLSVLDLSRRVISGFRRRAVTSVCFPLPLAGMHDC